MTIFNLPKLMDHLSTQENHIMTWSKGHKGRSEAWERLSSSLAKADPRIGRGSVDVYLKVVPRVPYGSTSRPLR